MIKPYVTSKAMTQLKIQGQAHLEMRRGSSELRQGGAQRRVLAVGSVLANTAFTVDSWKFIIMLFYLHNRYLLFCIYQILH